MQDLMLIESSPENLGDLEGAAAIDPTPAPKVPPAEPAIADENARDANESQSHGITRDQQWRA